MEVEGGDIDEGLYSRQLYVMGHEAQRRMGNSNVLLVGANGLGVEIAKNVVLAGVKSLVIHDDDLCKIKDLGSQFYLTEVDVGTPRSIPTATRLADLNEYVRVSSHTGKLDEDFLKTFTAVIVADGTLATKIDLNEICHRHNVCFIGAQINGLFANCFCDFGEAFTVSDTNGEPPIVKMLATVLNSNPGLVTVHDESRHGLETGDVIHFSEVSGMVELNDLPPVKITEKGPYTFEIDADTSNFAAYTQGGYVHQVKQPRVLSFLPLRDSLPKPGDFLLTDFAKLGRSELLHFAFQALDAYRAARDGAYPRPGNEADCEEVYEIMKKLAASASGSDLTLSEDELDESAKNIVMAFSSGSCAELSPMAAFLGGVVAQEVLKACSGKFTPIHQWLYFDAAECLPDEITSSVDPVGTRYDGEIAVFGKDFVNQLMQTKLFLVGAGAIGCELLKNFACMGVGCGDKGVVHVTDMDKIEKSNLNRQFLFRPSDVGSNKSTAAGRAACVINSEMHVEAYEDKVAPETETIFGDDFMASLDIICTALDNVDARLYVDQRCLNYGKAMLESGTLGTKGNTQVVIPHLTENYGATRDPPEKSVPICTLKNFPYQIEHTLQWARDWFEGAYTQTPLNVNNYLTQSDFMQRLNAQQNVKVETLRSLKSTLVTDRPRTFEECIKWARLEFEDKFANQIKQLLFNFPPGMLTSTGAPFWSGSKRQPTPLEFSTEDRQHMAFVISGANLRAAIYDLKGDTDVARFVTYLSEMEVPEFVPKSNLKIPENDKELQHQKEEDDMMDVDTVADNIVSEIPSPSSLAGFRLTVAEFEKDDETNFHMDFIAAASNMRARNYAIAEADKHKSKLIAGKIIPAIATTTALVTGLVCMELYKVVAQKKTVESFKSGFVNLALPFFAFSEPIQVKKTVAGKLEWSIWDKIEIDAVEKQKTLAEFLRHFEDQYQVEVNMLSYAVSILHSFFSPPSKKAERMKMTMSELVENVTKQPIDPNSKFLVFEVICVDKDDNDVDFPPVRYRIR